MKKASKVNEWCRKTAQQLNLSITTVKNAYRAALDSQGKINQEQLRLMLKHAQVNSKKRKNKFQNGECATLLLKIVF